MLQTLRIKNLALVEDWTLEFQPGYAAITGETGAGKSILIGALNLALGERADRSLIRSGSESCSVEAVFDAASMRQFLDAFCAENGVEPCADDLLVIKRSFSASGTNRQFINGSPTTLNVLAALGEALVDIHGPHDHQSLFHRGRQLEILDAFGGLTALRDEFAKLVSDRRELENRKTALVVDEGEYARKIDLLRHQVQEINAARLSADEEAELVQEHTRARNASRLLELSQAALNQLDGEDGSINSLAGQLGRTMQELRRVDPSTGCIASLHEQMVAAIRDLQSDLSHYAEKLDVDTGRLQALEERLNLIQSLKRKYGTTLEAVIEFGERSQLELTRLESRDAELARLNFQHSIFNSQLLATGRELSKRRRDLIPRFAKSVAAELKELGFKQANLAVGMESAAELPGLAGLNSSGLDTLEFQFAPNPGEPAKPLRAIASSGELARVMLALKKVLAEVDRIPVLIFDEMDANVGGETATAVGEKLRGIAAKHQVLCITHLAPVAALAQHHYVVTKRVALGRTTTEIQIVQGKERLHELARMLGGQSTAALRHAEELLRPDGHPPREPSRSPN